MRPVNNEGLLAHIEDLKYTELRKEFRDTLDNLMVKLKQTPRIKSINNRPLTGSMLLGMVLEYVDALNSKDVPVVMTSFERVVQVESRRFTEKLFEDVLSKLKI